MKFDLITTLPCADTTTSTSTSTSTSSTTSTTTSSTTTSTSTTPQCIPQDLQTVSPNIFTGEVALFGSFPSGYYQVQYLYGALMEYDDSPWFLNRASDDGYRVAHSAGGTIIEGPMRDYTGFSTQTALEQYNAGTVVSFYHTGGTIGMFLADSNLADNHPGSPNPTFLLRRICPS